jgi:hypothetical protein
MAQEKIKPAKKYPCSHCELYVSNATGLCGNCRSIPEEERAAQQRMRHRMIEGRKKADGIAKQAYADEMRKLNADAARAVTGSDAKPEDKAEARSLALAAAKERE